MNYYSELQTPLGLMRATYNDNEILGLYWLSNMDQSMLTKNFSFVKEHPLLDKLQTQLQEYFLGQRDTFDLPLNPQGTKFQKNAWQALRKIPYGKTVSYQEQATNLGSPNSVRAVGTANSKNPISILIPCHRVIAKSGQLSGYAGGVENKKKLLELEAGAGAV